jgi:electron transfer flavoprotein alpha subunit
MISSILSRRVNPILNVRAFQQMRLASTLVIAEPSSDSSSLASATLSTITAAQKLSGPITLLTSKSIDASCVPSSVVEIIETDLKDSLAESISNAVQMAQEANQFSHIVAPATKFGSNVLPRIASVLSTSPITDVIDILSEDTFIRPMYAGNVLAKVRSKESLKCLSVRSTAFDKSKVGDGSTDVKVTKLTVPPQTMTEFISANVSKSDRPDLSSASVVVSGGRGMKSGENFALLESLADTLNGAVGASRAAVDAGYVPNDLQVGQTGKVVAPDLYIAVGISGAIQHLSGMKDSKTIVAINTDPEAPIFQVADYGLVQDLFQVVPELTEKLK